MAEPGQRRRTTGQRRRTTVVIGGQWWQSTTVAGGGPPLNHQTTSQRWLIGRSTLRHGQGLDPVWATSGLVACGEPPLTAAGPPLTTTGPSVNGGWWAGQSWVWAGSGSGPPRGMPRVPTWHPRRC
nr:hypothetical protein [Tanacetum cinerariifolium]